MKNIVIIPEDKIKVLTSCHSFPANGYFTFEKEDAEVKRVPESWEELKELCKEINDKYYKKFKKNKIYLIEEDFIEFTGDDMYGFRVDKDDTLFTLSSNDFDQIFKTNQTLKQIWNIIKNLIGEE